MIWERYPGELAHHGIKGQKWGVKHGPPYPIKSAGDKKKQPIRITTISQERKANIARHNGLTFDDIPKKDYNDRDRDMAAVNPKYSGNDYRYWNNCTMCSMAYELRLRGFEVTANRTMFGRSINDISKWFYVNAKRWKTVETDDENLTEMKKLWSEYPNGSRGFISCNVAEYRGGPTEFHNMVWEKENENIILRDAQRNEKYEKLEESPISFAKYRYANIIRTDNLSINKEYVLDAIEFKKEV